MPIPLSCPSCNSKMTAPDRAAGREAKCPRCGKMLVVPTSVQIQLNKPASQEANPAPIPPVGKQPANQADSPSFPIPKGLILGGIGVALLIASAVVSNNLDEDDLRQVKIDNAMSDFGVRLGGYPQTKESKKSDRTPVYCLAVVGAVFIGLGVLSWVIEHKEPPESLRVSPDPLPKADWYYAKGGDKRGPVMLPALQALVRAGLLLPTDLVWKEGMAGWQPIASVKELDGNGSLSSNRTEPPPIPGRSPDSIRH
jgi:hypothetical protein